jgi:hypothetical protein
MTPEELAASKAAANLKRRLRLLWSGDSTNEEICEELEITPGRLASLSAEMGLGERSMSCYLPTKTRILVECAIFRMGWSDIERDSRIVGPLYGRLE